MSKQLLRSLKIDLEQEGFLLIDIKLQLVLNLQVRYFSRELFSTDNNLPFVTIV